MHFFFTARHGLDIRHSISHKKVICERIRVGMAQNKSHFSSLSRHLVGAKRRLQLETPTELDSFCERGDAEIFPQPGDRNEAVIRGTINAHVL